MKCSDCGKWTYDRDCLEAFCDVNGEIIEDVTDEQKWCPLKKEDQHDDQGVL